EKEILQSKRLASIGILVAGVAHELNNPLNNISMMAQTYMEVYDNLEREQRIDFMERVEEETERLRVIIKNLLDFSRAKERHLVENVANNVIQKTIALVRNMLNVSNIQLRLDLADDLPTIYVDEHQVQQVLVNITTNAIQAMGNTGVLFLRSSYLADADEVEFEIRDTGPGIEAKFLDHIFDPFFTTKEEGGTGLGLWVSYGIIKNHGGNLRVESSADDGTAFFVTLPSCKSVKECCDGQA
ncbi:MAG: ATP-binding protein, partial [Desulfobulbaceae bacterium]|nr:ATP-binding protein [Desulfobulbaceae bacterium]